MPRQQSGFTLVELAIVLMIIGLLIGGVLRGQELMANARLQGVIKQVTSYTGATNLFMDTYGARPGDLSTATSRITGCTAANNCFNGNSDGVVGNLARIYDGSQQGIATENTQFWKHLALTHIISGVDPSASVSAWAKSNPVSPVGGGYSVDTGDGCNGGQAGNGCSFPGALVLRLHGSLSDISLNYTRTTPLSPRQAYYIDRKMDDGVPGTGDVQAAGQNSSLDCQTTYNQTREDEICILAFVMNR